MESILYSNIGGLNLSRKDSYSNLFGMTQVYLYMCVYICVYTCVLPKGFEHESFQLKYNPLTFEYKIYSVDVDLYYFKYLNQKSSVWILFIHASNRKKRAA